jgi:hypothetical protein
MLLGMGYPTDKKTSAGTGMGKNSNPHAGMSFLRVGVRVGGCRYGTTLPDGFLPVASDYADVRLMQTECGMTISVLREKYC